MLLIGALAVAGLALPAAAPVASAAVASDPAALVNPFIGTANGANDFPGADSPFGMVQWSPDTTSRPSAGGYAYGDTAITGFSLTHVAGAGCNAEGDFPVLPTVGAVNDSETQGFAHSSESADAGYYSVTTANGVKTELTTTTRSGMARFTFPASTQANLVFKMTGSQTSDTGVKFTVVSNDEVSGQVTTGGFCGESESYTVYFDMAFDQPFTSSSGTTTGDGSVTFNTTSNPVVQAKVGLSYVSTANAAANRTAENSGWNFDTTHAAATAAWNSTLGRIGISGGTSDQQTAFYTALYHSLLFPQVFSDANGQYHGVDGQTHTVDAGHSAFYTDFSGWDIYRSQAQLSALVAPSQTSDIAQSMVDDYAQSGQFPKWMLNNGETYVMVGDPADAILADYYAFGAQNFDTATALKDMIAEATAPNNVRVGSNYLEQLGYVPTDGSFGCCNADAPTSATLEYDTDDAAISFLAGALGDTADQSSFISRAQDWQNLLNPASGFIEPRNENGQWGATFNPEQWGWSPFAEGTSWMYTPMVPFNIHGLAQAEGGNAAMTTFLNTDLSTLTGASGHADLTNEPSLDIPWEYDYVGAPSKTQAAVREAQDQLWSNTPSGLDGPGGTTANDDLGAMSSWYVWSALGMYPETPGTATLALGSPVFTQAVITLPSGNTLTVNGNGAADNAPYVQSATWNSTAWNNAYLPTTALTSGGTFNYTLGTTANTSWASSATAAPPSYQGTATYSDAGISDDTKPANADFDGSGYSYSAQALAAAGLTPGSTVTANGLTFTWPGAASGTPDNYEANGQTVPLTGSGSISFLGSANSGPSTGTATVTYTDGTTQNVSITLSDWTLNGGSASAAAGNTIVATSAYRNQPSGGSQAVKTYVYATAPVTLTAGKVVSSVRLPSDATAGGLHVFAIATQAGAIGSGVSSNLCADDNQSQTADGNKIQIWTCNGTGAQEWTPTAANTLTVLGACMTVDDNGTTNGSLILLWDCNGGANQVWKPGPNGSLINPVSGKCLDDPNSSTTIGTQLQLYTCNGTTAQRWHLP